jgi:hypothetical protein
MATKVLWHVTLARFFLMAISEIPLKNGGFRWENPALPRLITGGYINYIVQAG